MKEITTAILTGNRDCFDTMLALFPIANAFDAVPQNPHYHAEGSVLVHTRLVCRRLTEFPEWAALADSEKVILYLAAFFHDIGKTFCTREENGEIISPGHARKGAVKFRELAYLNYAAEYGMDAAVREQVVGLVRYHGLPLWFLEKDNIELTVRRAACKTNLKWLTLLAKADLTGRVCQDQDSLLERISYFGEYAAELGCLQAPPHFPDPYTRYRYLSGSLAWYGDVLFEPPAFDVHLMSGLPLSGKDTYIAASLSKLPVISLDDIREELHIRPSDGSAAVVRTALVRAKELLRCRTPFVWNATNLTHEIRARLIRLLESYGARVSIRYLEAPFETLLMRNAARARTVPEAVIRKMVRTLEIPEPWEAQYVETGLPGGVY